MEHLPGMVTLDANSKYGVNMKKILVLSIFFILLFSCIFADTNTGNNAAENIQLFKEHTEGIISFINADQNKEVSKQIDYKIPVVHSEKAVKSVSKSIEKQNIVQPVATFAPQKYDFSNNTSYGSFKVLVIQDNENTFKVSFSSDDPIQRYQLYDTTTKAITQQENLNDKNVYSFIVYKKFEPKYVLLLSMYKDDFLSQNIIPLYKKETIKFK